MNISSNLDDINKKIRELEIKYRRASHSVSLLAVSKKQSIEKIREAFLAGQIAFAENYAQEAIEKQIALKDLKIEWHFIGNIQSNKTKLIANHFEWVQSVNRIEIAEKLNAHRPTNFPPLNICIEVNIDDAPTKSGVTSTEIFHIAEKIKSLKLLKLRGLMVIPKIDSSHNAFEKATALYQELIQAGFSLDTLSMGMSSDFEDAIAAGSTMVRIGTGIFGERK